MAILLFVINDIHVEGLLEYLAAGDTIQELLKEFLDLEKEDFQACIQYAF
jgi:uncharacterized protein (DUF433 family)